MQKKQFQQNMKDKVRVFEDGGIRLLKRGQKGVVHAIFSRFGLVLVLLLLQAFALFSLLQWFGGLLPHYFGGTLLVTAAMMVCSMKCCASWKRQKNTSFWNISSWMKA